MLWELWGFCSGVSVDGYACWNPANEWCAPQDGLKVVSGCHRLPLWINALEQ